MITVLDQGQPHSFSYDEMEKYHGPLAPGGIAMAYKIMRLAFPVFSADGPIQRLELKVETSFPGLGVKDSFEIVTRAVSRGCYDFDLSLGNSYEDYGVLRGFVFRLTYLDRSLTYILRSGILRDEFIALVGKGKERRSPDEEIHFMWLKTQLGATIMARHESAVFELVADSERK